MGRSGQLDAMSLTIVDGQGVAREPFGPRDGHRRGGVEAAAQQHDCRPLLGAAIALGRAGDAHRASS